MTMRGVRAFTLQGDDVRTEVAVPDTMGLAREGAVVHVERALTEPGVLSELENLYFEGIAAVASPAAVDKLRRDGLQRMHDVLEPREIAALLPVLDHRAKPFAVPVARRLVSLCSNDARDYFICARTWVRAQVPYRLVAEDDTLLSQSHLLGHLVPTTPHRDVELTHPRGTLSMWMAVGPIESGNTIELFDVDRPPLRASLDHSDARTVRPALAPGDMLVFDADRLHATVPNTTDETRVSVGLRVVFGRALHYGPGTHWRPFHDARLVGTRLESLSTLQSRCTAAAVRRWWWRRAWNREQARAEQQRPPVEHAT